ncbi:hypothetical protein [Kocuria sp. HSID16901]|uniref:hypothetical protein n=1 Tax=Kocuria sp. HSID16901 TaxID=2419505 RepID=UPI000F862CFF|nr:hypothetical protein [Kocuria sp. HSID16901]RUQ19837.1 hypothetical protein D8M21_10980 [Kocuria sp. HSID16901]
MSHTAGAAPQPGKLKRRPIIRWIIIATLLLPILAGLFHAEDVSYPYVAGFAFGTIVPIAILAILTVMLTRWVATRAKE